MLQYQIPITMFRKEYHSTNIGGLGQELNLTHQRSRRGGDPDRPPTAASEDFA